MNNIVDNKGWHLEIDENNVVLSRNGINIIEGINDYYDVIRSLSEYLKESETPKCIRVHNTENKATAVISIKDFKRFKFDFYNNNIINT